MAWIYTALPLVAAALTGQRAHHHLLRGRDRLGAVFLTLMAVNALVAGVLIGQLAALS